MSADMAHCLNPNYSEKTQSDHKISMHEGIAIKVNPNMRYATDSEGTSLLKEIARRADVPIQV
jgi:aspartyl aminopeptidase